MGTIAEHIIVKADPKKRIIQRWDDWERSMAQEFPRWEQIYKLYHGYIADKEKNPSKANFHFHQIFPQIEAESARYVMAMMTQMPIVNVTPRGSGTEDSADLMEACLQYYYDICPVFYLKMFQYIKRMRTFGYAWMIPSWKRQTAMVKERQAYLYDGQPTGFFTIEETEQVIYEGLWFDVYSPYEMAVSRQSEGSGAWQMPMEFLSLDDVLDLAGKDGYEKALIDRIPLNAYKQNSRQFNRLRGVIGKPNLDQDTDVICFQHEITPKRITTLANGEIVVRDIPNPLWKQRLRAVKGFSTVDPDGLESTGSAHQMVTNQKLTNLTNNISINRFVHSASPLTLVAGTKATAAAMSGRLIPRAGVAVPVDDVDRSVRYMELPQNQYDAQIIRDVLRQSNQDTTGYYGSQMGNTQDSQGNTATAEQIYNEQAQKRISADVLTFERCSMLPLGRDCADMIMQYMPEGTEVRIGLGQGAGFLAVSPEDVRGEYMFSVTGASESINRAVVQRQMIDFTAIATGLQQYVRDPMTGAIMPVPVLDAYNWAKDICGGWNKNAEQVLYRPEVFGIPVTNEMFGEFGLPPVQGLEQMQSRPGSENPMRQGQSEMQRARVA